MKKQVVYVSPINGARVVVDKNSDPYIVKMFSGLKLPKSAQ